MRLVKSEIQKAQSTTGEIDCLKWRNILFTWIRSINNVDEYEAKGLFIGIHPKYAYENLIISADFEHNIFFLKTGHGRIVTWINLLDI